MLEVSLVRPSVKDTEHRYKGIGSLQGARSFVLTPDLKMWLEELLAQYAGQPISLVLKPLPPKFSVTIPPKGAIKTRRL